MKPKHRYTLVAGAALMIVVLAGHLRAALIPHNLTVVSSADLAASLVGAGVSQIENVTFTGAPIAAGTFSGGADIIGFDAGVILSTGNIATVVGPNNSGAASTNLGLPSSPDGLPGDTDLTNLSGLPTHDATVLEFDFVPDKNKVFLQYVFASEEYNENVNRKIGGKLFNDAFAFYINGVNCATIGGLPVTIQTINNGGPSLGAPPTSHPELFINNDFHPSAPLDTQMDGLTKVLTCQAAVLPNVPNHIKVAIADVSDARLDSNVFLRSASFTTTPPLTIVKKTNNRNNDVGPAPLIAAGGPVLWTYEIANNGVDALTSVTVSDDKLGPIGCPAATLAPGAAMTCAANGTAVLDDYTNIGTVVGTSPIIGPIEDSNPDRYFGARPGIRIVTKTNHTDNDAAPGPAVLVGSPVTWTYEVTNTGNVALSNVLVSDSTGVPVDCSVVPGGPPKTGVLAGETMVCTASGTAIAGQYENTGTASAAVQVLEVSGAFGPLTVTDANPDHYFGADPKIALLKKTDGTHHDAAPGPLVLVGDPVSWTYVVTNTGNVALADVAVTDDKQGPICTIGALAVGQTAAPCAKTANAVKGQYQNTGTATGSYGPVGTTNGPADTVTINGHSVDYYFGADPKVTLVKKTNHTDNPSAPGPFVLVGDPVSWTYVVSNTGNVTLSDLTVTDDKEGAVCTIATLAAGQTAAECTKSGTARKGDYTNIGSVTAAIEAVTATGQTKVVAVTGSDLDRYFGADPHVAVTKKTNGGDNDAAPGRFVLVGDPVNWTYTVTNTGNVPLTDLAVTDDKEGPICTIASLAAGATAPACAKAGIARRDQYSNTGTASARFDLLMPGGQVKTVTVTGTNPDNYFGADPRMSIKKKINGVDAETAPGPLVLAGDPIVWTYLLTNTGNVPLTNVAIGDDKEGPICAIATLPVGSSTAECSRSGIATKGSYQNVGTASATFEIAATDGSTKIVNVTTSDASHYFGADPKLTLVKKTNGNDNDAPPGRSLLVGDPVRWTYVVTNVGNVPLAGVAVTDDKEGAICTIASLAPGETAAECSRSSTAARGQYHNTGTATSRLDTLAPGGQSKTVAVTGSNGDYYFGADPRLSIIKKTDGTDNDAAPGRFLLAGDPVVWTYAVTNTGNVPLANITILDNKEGAVCTIATLAVDQTAAICSKSGIVQKGQYANTGAAGTTYDIATIDGQPRTVAVTASNIDYYFGADPRVTLLKKTNGTDNDLAPGPTILAGSQLTWTFAITNTGNVPLSNVSVIDDKEGAICTAVTINVGQTSVCTKSGIVKPGPYVNTGSVTGGVDIVRASGLTETILVSSSNVDHYFGADPRITIVKKTLVFGSDSSYPPGHYQHDGHDTCENEHYGKRDDDDDRNDKKGSSGDNDRRDDGKNDGKNKNGGKDKNGSDRYSEPDRGHDNDRDDDRRHDDDNNHNSGNDHTPKAVESDNNVAPGPIVKVGTAIGWKYTVTNTGNVPLTNVAIVDDKEGFVCTIGALGVGQTAPACTKNGTAVAGQYENTGTATGNFGPVFVNGAIVPTVTVTASDVDHYLGARPAIGIVKQTNGTDNAAPGPSVLVGSTVTWTYVITNTGNLPLADVKLVDDRIGSIRCPSKTLTTVPDPGSTMTCSAAGKAVRGRYMNTGTVTASSAFGMVEAEDDDYYTGIEIKIPKSPNYGGPGCR